MISYYVCGCVFGLFDRDFLNSLRMYRTHYGGLADQLCVSELASGDGLSCWNGIDAVKRYLKREKQDWRQLDKTLRYY